MFVALQQQMKKILAIILFTAFINACSYTANAQCSVCSKTVSQMGEKPAKGLNQGIIYLIMTPFAIVGIIGYRWWKSEKNN